MTSLACIALAAVLTAAEPTTHQALQRHASILTAVGGATAIAGGIVLGVGVSRRMTELTVGGTALVGLGLTCLALAIIAFIWPDDVPVQVAEGRAWPGTR